ncbi:hypothetical protein pCXcHC2016_24 [Xenohaliotis phage pCXc-HC2016]|nr:hypothetical protein pCXcHC2016_24 [Xenohaliotis phage pCXc-HC2016]AQW89131.1 hypothetical protein pCXcHR2015_24 [Xenohaliotis phage pCXc-HR2015]
MSRKLILEIFEKYLAAKYDLQPNAYLLNALAMTLGDKPIIYPQLLKLVQKVIEEQIYIDNIIYSLVSYRGRWVITESYKNLLHKLIEKGWYILTQPLSQKQLAEIENDGNHLMANETGVYPISSVIHLGQKKDVAGIQLRVVTKDGMLIENKIYTTKSLLITAKKAMRADGVITSVCEKATPVRGVWNSDVSDFVEMLKKTAIRNTIKNLI